MAVGIVKCDSLEESVRKTKSKNADVLLRSPVVVKREVPNSICR